MELWHYSKKAKDGNHLAFPMQVLYKVKYPLGIRDLVFFIIVDKKGNPKLDSDKNPITAVAVCNHTKRKSVKAKINRIARCLVRPIHRIDKLQSYFNLPDIEDVLWDPDLPKHQQEPISIFVQNKTVGENTVSNVTKIYSWLDKDFVNIEQKFDTAH